MDALKVTNLNKNYLNFCLKDISISLEEGFIMGFIGRNGAGKTTTLKSIYNLIHFESGKVEIFGKDFAENELELKQSIGFSMGGFSFYPHQSLKNITKITKSFYKNWNNDLYLELIGKFKLVESKKISELSEGMKVKYSLALALSHGAKLLILDEPTSGLDPISRDEVLDIFQEQVEKNNVSILFSTQIVSDLEKCADYITYIKDGEIIISKQKDDFLDSYLLIKGDKNLLDEKTNKLFLGFKENKFGFVGLISKVDVDSFSKFEKEKADIESIMVLLERGNK